MTEEQADLELLEKVVLGSARGGRKPLGECEVAVVRSLTPEDLPALAAAQPLQVRRAPTPKQLRHSHHQLARLLAAGRSESEASLITGYGQAYISNLKQGQDFKDLLNYYSEQKQEIFVDALERMKVLGLSMLDELQARLEAEPDGFTKQQVMDAIELLLVKSQKALAQSAPGGALGVRSSSPAGGVRISVEFVEPPPRASQAQILDVTPQLVEAK